jgi:hypothetical protein
LWAGYSQQLAYIYSAGKANSTAPARTAARAAGTSKEVSSRDKSARNSFDNGRKDARIERVIVEEEKAAPDPQTGFAEFFGAASFAAYTAKRQVLAAYLK